MTRTLFRTALLLAVFCVGTSAYAAVPTMSFSTVGGNSVQVRIKGDARSVIKLQYPNSLGDIKSLSLGTTDSEGLLSKTITSSDIGLSSGSSVYVTSSVTGDRSATKTWPYFGSTNISFPFSPFPVPVGESGVITVTNPASASLIIQKNSNATVLSANVNGSQLELRGRANGTAVLTVCTTDSKDCEDLTVLVGSGTVGSSAQGLQIYQTDPVLIVGKSTVIPIGGATQNYYISSNSNPSIAQAVAGKNSITVTANAIGSTKITVCSPAGSCGTLAVSVLTDKNTSTDTTILLNHDHLDLKVGELGTVLIAGGGTYTAKSNNVNIATSTLPTGSSHLVITGISVGTATIKVCTPSNDCDSVSVAVSPAPVIVPPVTVPPPVPVPPVATTSASFTFTSYLKPGSSGTEVSVLQLVLAKLGYLKVTPNGNYGAQTEAAVKAFQAAHTLEQLGVVGPATRAALNALATTPGVSSSIPATSTTTPHVFKVFIGTSSTGTEVTFLQKRLTALGVYSGPITGTYGPLTEAAVKKLQSAHGITPAGYVGPSTRTLLNQP